MLIKFDSFILSNFCAFAVARRKTLERKVGRKKVAALARKFFCALKRLLDPWLLPWLLLIGYESYPKN